MKKHLLILPLITGVFLGLVTALDTEQSANAARQEGEKRERRQSEGSRKEIEIVKKRVEVLRKARVALLEGNRRELAEQVQRAIRAYEVGLEGRRDKEAQVIRSRMPKAGQMAEVLNFSSKLWREFGHPKEAEAVGKLATEMSSIAKRQRKFQSGNRERDESKQERAREREEHARRQRHEAELARDRRSLEEAIARARELAQKHGNERVAREKAQANAEEQARRAEAERRRAEQSLA